MKLSEMTNKEAFKAIAQILPIAKEIVKDQELLNIWFRKNDSRKGNDIQEIKRETAIFNIDRNSDLIMYVLDKHSKNVFKILGILNGKSAKAIEEQNFLETISQLTEALNDEALQKLFT